jgi:cellulose synthase/poly-beta-1,6-N-acetylglucosamine synthase-like glycosyltransferase
MNTFLIFWQIVFWTSACLLFYTYIGYPLFVYLLSKVRPKDVKRENIEPKVTILITAYNEERDIKAKLENTFLLDYPKDKLEILVASDGSTDNTDNIVRKFSAQNVRLFRQEGRVGKTITQNNAVEQSNGEIILFSDATTDYQPNVLREIMPNFADKTVGCVAGKLIYVDKTKSAVGKGAKGYWNYETFLKESESRACSLIGASGCLYAVRKSAYKPMYAEACSDFLIATLVFEQGLRTVYEPNAICEEETNRQTDKEFSMRVRVISQTFTDLWRNRRMLNPLRSGFYAIQLISHKVFRYAVPLFLLLTFISTVFLSLDSWFFDVVLLLQVLFYATAFVAWLAEKFGKKPGIFAIPLYFVLANWASVVAFAGFLSGETYARWEPIRESKESNTFSHSA